MSICLRPAAFCMKVKRLGAWRVSRRSATCTPPSLNAQHSTLPMPYIPHTEEDRQEMLATIGAKTIDELFREIPENLRVKGELDIPPALDEARLYAHLGEIAAKNLDMTKVSCFLGAGIYDRYMPATVGAVISRGEFLTAYTPYQP